MLVTLEGAVKVMLAKGRSLNKLFPILVRPVPMVAVARLLQSLNGLPTRVVTLLGMLMLVMPV